MIPSRFFELDDLGWSASAIGSTLGVCARTVQRWRAASGRRRGEAVEPHPAAERELVRALVAGGASFADAGRTVGVSRRTARSWASGLPGWTPVQAGEYAQMLRQERAHVG